MRALIRSLSALVVLFAWNGAGLAQVAKPASPDLARLADGQGAQAYNRALTTTVEGGRGVARLDARAGDGGVVFDGVQLGDGVIEIDLKGKDVAQRSFLGVAFRMVDWTTFDAVYFRPFNFRGPDAERRSHSVQYVSHPLNTWQRLRAEHPGRYESALEPPPDPNEWFHARIVLAGPRVEVFVDGSDKPALSVTALGAQQSGGVALFVGNGSDGAFRAMTITAAGPVGPPPPSTQNVFDAARTGNVARLRALVEKDPKVVGMRMLIGATPLHLAAANGQRAAAEFLLEHGADINAVARHAGTPLDLVLESDARTLAGWLEARGARTTPIRFDITEITPAVHRLAYPWGMMNNVLVYSARDGLVLVDSGFSTRAVPELRRAIAGLSRTDIACLINSHDHGDHVAGNAVAPPGVPVITAASLASGGPSGPAVGRTGEPLKGRTGRTLPAPFGLRVAGSDILVIPRPGLHSDADLVVWFKDQNVVAMGDLLLSESVPALSDIPGYLAFLDDVLDVFPAKTIFVSGHGRDLDAAGVKVYRDTLAEMAGVVRTHRAAGRTVEEMRQADILKDYKPRFSLLDFLPVDSLIPSVVSALEKGTLK